MQKTLERRFTLEEIEAAKNKVTDYEGIWDYIVQNLTFGLNTPDTKYSIYELFKTIDFGDYLCEDEFEFLEQITYNLGITQEDIIKLIDVWRSEKKKYKEHDNIKAPQHGTYDSEKRIYSLSDYTNTIQIKKENQNNKFLIPDDVFAKIAQDYYRTVYRNKLLSINPLMSENPLRWSIDAMMNFDKTIQQILAYNECCPDDPKPVPYTEEQRLKYLTDEYLIQNIQSQIITNSYKKTKPIADEYYKLIYSKKYTTQRECVNQAILNYLSKTDPLFKYQINLTYLKPLNQIKLDITYENKTIKTVKFDNKVPFKSNTAKLINTHLWISKDENDIPYGYQKTYNQPDYDYNNPSIVITIQKKDNKINLLIYPEGPTKYIEYNIDNDLNIVDENNNIANIDEMEGPIDLPPSQTIQLN